MWLVSLDRDFYPSVKKYKTYDKALEEYNWQKENISDNDCVFIAEVKEFSKGKDYDMDSNPQL